MLHNAHSLAKIGADTAENERYCAENLPKICNYPTGPDRSSAEPRPLPDAAPLPAGVLYGLALLQAGLGAIAAAGVRSVSKISKLLAKIMKNLQNFGGLVLGCIKTKFCKKICV